MSAGEGHGFVFVAGLHRSGTTLLARLLAAHPEISGFSGTGAPADEGQHLQSVYPCDYEYGSPGRFGFAPEMHLTESSALVSEENAERLLAEWSPYWDLSRRLLLEKSPPNLIKTRFLQALFPNSTFIVVIRHPIPVSIPTAKWRGTRRYDRLLDHWLHCYGLFEADHEQLDRVHVLTYEQLVGDPAGVLEEVFAFLEVEPILPSEPVETGANEKYFRRWKELKRDPQMRAYLDLVSLKYEHRVRSYGYSLLRPVPRKPLPAWALVSRPPSQHERSASFERRARGTSKPAAAALAIAAIVLAALVGSLSLNAHRHIRPTSARSRACERGSERTRVACGAHQREKTPSGGNRAHAAGI